MKMRKRLLTVLAAFAFAAVPAMGQESVPVYKNTSYSFEERAVDLVSRLTLEEKQALLGNNMAAVPRLGIKQYNVWSEALHGVLSGANASVGLQGPTSFPGSVALGSTWDPDLLELEASVIADEARAIFQTGTKGLTFWSPVVEPIRDPRWGRTGESYGEDPFLAAVMSGGFVRGMMGDDPNYIKAVPCAKHYFANNSEFDRHVGSSNMDSRDMREFYLYPYKELIEKDNLPSIMSSYNAVNHVPTSASGLYLDTIARRTYGMKGYVTGDCAAIEDIYTGHYYVETAEEATAAGLKAGVDSDCGSVYQRYALSALEKGLITEADMDRALVNMFTIRMRTGEFDPLMKVPYTNYPPSTVNSERSQAIALEVATRTPVLLKNDQVPGKTNKALPISLKDIKSIALIGPQADRVELGPYSGRPEQSSRTSPYAGISKYIADKGLDIEVTLAQGGSTKSKSNLLYIAWFELEKSDGSKSHHDATQYSSSSEGITVGSGMGTEEQVRSIDDGSWTAYENIDLVDVEKITVAANIPTEGGIIEMHVGSPEGNLIGSIEATRASGKRVGGVYGTGTPMEAKINKLGYNGPQTLYLVYKAPEDDEIAQDVLDAARKSDVAIVFVGTDENTATEEADRLTLNLPGNQVKLIQAVARENKNTIVVMQTLGCVEVEDFKNLENIPGILWTGYNGQAQGAAIPMVLFGDVTPGGKLNATWYRSVKDLPPITDYTLRAENGKPGRTLWYFTKPVSYEFGYGLSYTTFEYSDFTISKSSITPDDKITVSVKVKNTGDYDGDEVVQIYMTTPDSPASLQRPIKRLKGFKRVTIPRGQTRLVEIEIDCSDLWFWDMEGDRITYDSGRYIFEIGSSSQDIRGTVSATMNGKFTPQLKTVVSDCRVSVLEIGQTAQFITTAALTDDSFINLDNATVQFVSSNPDVAQVSESGLLTANGSGIATITTIVTYNGKSVSDSYSIKVNPDLTLASLKNGSVSLLKPGRKQYSILSSKPGKIIAMAKANRIAAKVEQADKVPGTAVVTVADPITGDADTYLVNFGTKGISDEFNGSSLGKQWNVIRRNDENLLIDNGWLEIIAETGDINGTADNAANMVLQSANTDWTIETRLATSAVPASAQNAGLVAYQDDSHFVKFVYAPAAFRRGQQQAAAPVAPASGNLQLYVEENGSSKSTVSVNLADAGVKNNTICLKLDKDGSIYTAYYSVDGKTWIQAGQVEVSLKDIQAGVMACQGVMNMRMGGMGMRPGGAAAAASAQQNSVPFRARFDWFRIKNR
ncbi:MAG: glycoside hydrolase family 3 C-terminal domain-containing protein [Bacteroidaceae bacterium]|nr:glycoside hydrolase family 3 C-terminal domain-containing protein [Bacteroidaceae bacterium]